MNTSAHTPTVADEPTVRRNVVIRASLDERFRRAIALRDGLGKGNLRDAMEEAIELWLKQNEAKAQKTQGGGRT